MDSELKKRLAAEKSEWEERFLKAGTLREIRTPSNLPLNCLYTPLDFSEEMYPDKLGLPGHYPFTRGCQPSMYRGRLWTIRQYAGFGTPEETNARFRFLLEHGQTGLSVALDLPTQMGLDSDHPLAQEEVGGVGVALDSVEDMQTLLDGISLDKISINFTANATAAIILAMYLTVAERQGIPLDVLRGTIQNDILKEFIARNTYIFPPEPSLRLATDIIEFCGENIPHFNPISISGYHAREAGATAIQEVAYALAAGIVYVEWMLARNVAVDVFAPQLSFHFSSQRDLFEEVCKIRAARRLWARIMQERFGAQNPRSQMMRYFNGGSGLSLTHVEPINNIVRGTLQCLAGVLAGAQACHVPSYDEAFDIPSEEAALVSVRTQQIIAYESGVGNVVDPLGGAYFIEALTDQLEREIETFLRKIEESGGYVAAIERGEIQKAILEKAYEMRAQVDHGEWAVVGQNIFAADPVENEIGKAAHRSADSYANQAARLARLREKRNVNEVQQTLEKLKSAAEGSANLLPPIMECVKAYATVGEIVGALVEVFGKYEPPFLL